MRIGSYNIDEGALLLGGFAVLVVILLLYTWIRNTGDLDRQKSIAIDNQWTWLESPPTDLTQSLSKLQRYRPAWQANHIMAVNSSDQSGYLFDLNRDKISGFESSSLGRVEARACIIPGATETGTPILRIKRKPTSAVKAALDPSTRFIEHLGSHDFRDKFVVSLEGLEIREQSEDTGSDEEIERLLSQVKISSEFESVLIRWHRPLGQLLPWSDIFLRHKTVMVTRNRRDQAMTESDWRQLLQMCRELSGALR